ncbi:hypothetical protein [Paenibacillus xylanilyticus]|uniref:Uncharacterized protein n=1 Tax=Paenibacillus xylanilyticus TaxID=248903 RepID=A0A7Y6BT05_9BACL|nr:hypothetical protein [Paenibacillus xylanilyticus]NUU74256.1 hypothetical protein [Paenibacillus xylanilyticus]
MLNIKQRKDGKVTVYVTDATVKELVVSDILTDHPHAGAAFRVLPSGRLAVTVKRDESGIEMVNALLEKTEGYRMEARRAYEIDSAAMTKRLQLV